MSELDFPLPASISATWLPIHMFFSGHSVSIQVSVLFSFLELNLESRLPFLKQAFPLWFYLFSSISHPTSCSDSEAQRSIQFPNLEFAFPFHFHFWSFIVHSFVFHLWSFMFHSVFCFCPICEAGILIILAFESAFHFGSRVFHNMCCRWSSLTVSLHPLFFKLRGMQLSVTGPHFAINSYASGDPFPTPPPRFWNRIPNVIHHGPAEPT